MTLYPLVLEMKKMLGQMNGWIDKAEAHAASKDYDPNTLLQARLAPDMFPLVRQFQNACDTAKFAAAFTTGKEPPSHPDTEQTFAADPVAEMHPLFREVGLSPSGAFSYWAACAGVM